MSSTFTSVTPAPKELLRRKGTVTLTAEQTGHLLALGRHPVDRLKRTGYLATPTLAAAEALANRPTVSGGVAVLRLGDPAMDSGRRVGHQRADDDATLLGASLGWWGGPVEAVADIGWLALSVASFVVAVLRIDGVKQELIDERNYRRVHFEGGLAGRIDDLVESDPRIHDERLADVSMQLLGNRVPNPQGAPIVIV